jgi:hypothetical protein
MVRDDVGVFNMGGKENRGVGGKTRYIYLCSSDVIHILPVVG